MSFLLVTLSWFNLGMQTAGEPLANKNLNFLFAAYTVVWVLLLGYIVSVARRQKRLESELEMLKQMKTEK